ncbi:MAG: HU family DNA-binding protein [Gemmobacter sp.]
MAAHPDLSALALPQLHALRAAVGEAIRTRFSHDPNLKGHPMGTKATKSDLITHLADHHCLSKADASRAVHAALEFIADAVNDGTTVMLQGFGTFEPRHRAARTGRNPATGEAIEIAASTTMGFRPAKRKAS